MEENAAVRALRLQTAQSIEEWAKEVRKVGGDGIHPTFVEARVEYILTLIKAINHLKSLS